VAFSDVIYIASIKIHENSSFYSNVKEDEQSDSEQFSKYQNTHRVPMTKENSA
jgi:hypothetical protein